MKNSVFFLFTLPLIVTFVILFSTSCNEPPKVSTSCNEPPKVSTSCNEPHKVQNYCIQTIDSCEYIVSTWDRSRTMTHKGNCKFCKIRDAKTDTIYIQSCK